VIALLLLLGGLVFALAAIRSKEVARLAAREHCRVLGLALLDDTVVLTRLLPQRNEQGHLVWQRRYRFEFSQDGEQRYTGALVLLGRHVQGITTDAYRWTPDD
jgi:hypothetical protein